MSVPSNKKPHKSSTQQYKATQKQYPAIPKKVIPNNTKQRPMVYNNTTRPSYFLLVAINRRPWKTPVKKRLLLLLEDPSYLFLDEASAEA